MPVEEQAARSRLGGQSITGGVMSRATVTVKVQVARSPQILVAVQVTVVVVPRMNGAPEGGLQMTVTGPVQFPPEVVGVGYTTGAVLLTPQIQLVRLSGQLMLRGGDIWATAVETRASRPSSVAALRMIRVFMAVLSCGLLCVLRSVGLHAR